MYDFIKQLGLTAVVSEESQDAPVILKGILDSTATNKNKIVSAILKFMTQQRKFLEILPTKNR